MNCPYCNSKQEIWIGESVYLCQKCQKPFIALLAKVFDENPLILILDESWQNKVKEKFNFLQATKTEHIKVEE